MKRLKIKNKNGLIFAIIFICGANVFGYSTLCSSKQSAHVLNKNIIDISDLNTKNEETFGKELGKSISVLGSQNLIITMLSKNDQRQEVSVDKLKSLNPNEELTFEALAEPVTLFLRETNQQIVIASNSKIKLVGSVSSLKSKEKCMYAFALEKGKVTFNGYHENIRECSSDQSQTVFELATQNIIIEPIGTKYSVDMNQVVAEMNGEKYDEEANIKARSDMFKSENIHVEKGTIAIRLRKAKNYKQNKITYNNDDFEDEKILLKEKSKAKTKKSKKERVADVEVVYPQD